MSGHLKIVRRHKSPFWYIRGSIRGTRYEESTGIVDDGRASKRYAEEIRANRETEIIERSIRAKAGKPRTLQDRVASKFASFLRRNIEPAGYLYRHYHPSGDLIYVGITQSLSKRTNAAEAAAAAATIMAPQEPAETNVSPLHGKRGG
jgi:hypothetical protein